MLNLNKLFFYLLQGLVIFLLIKALTPETNNANIAFLSAAIIIVVIVLNRETFEKPERMTTVSASNTGGGIIESVFSGPPTAPPRKLVRDVDTTKYPDEDIEDLKDIMMVDKKLIQRLDENEKKAREKIRAEYKDDMRFTNTHEFNTIPLGSQIYSYTMLPPENWFRAYERPPTCISDRKCPVCPTISSGSSMVGLMEFEAASNVTGPLGIDTKYIEQKLNTKPSYY